MPETNRGDDVEKLLAEEKAFEERKQSLIGDLLKQKEAALKEFDDKLGKLGYHATTSGRPRRSHHSKSVPSPDAASKKPKTT